MLMCLFNQEKQRGDRELQEGAPDFLIFKKES